MEQNKNEYEYVMQKITNILGGYGSAFEHGKMDMTQVKADIAVLDAKMWDEISKDELTSMLIGDDNVLTLEKLYGHPSVIRTLIDSQRVIDTAIGEYTEEYINIEDAIIKIDAEVEEILMDYVLFGLDHIRTRLLALNDFVASQL